MYAEMYVVHEQFRDFPERMNRSTKRFWLKEKAQGGGGRIRTYEG
jgi:hypothetical protein